MTAPQIYLMLTLTLKPVILFYNLVMRKKYAAWLVDDVFEEGVGGMREVGDFSYVTVHIQRSNINILRASANLQQRPIVMLLGETEFFSRRGHLYDFIW